MQSEIELPEMYPAEGVGKPDVYIKIDKCPSKISDSKIKDWYFTANTLEFLMNVDEVANFYITGNTITVEPLTENISAVRLYLLGSTFTALLYQISILPLHAGVVIRNNEAIAFSGESGAGKSTTIAQLASRGYKILSDDVCAIQQNEADDSYYAYPAYPQIKLCEDALVELGQNYKDLPRIHSETRKYTYISDRFETNPHKLARIYTIEYSDTPNTLEINTLNGHQKYEALLKSTHRPEMMRGLSKQIWHFKYCEKIGNNVEVREITHSYDLNNIHEFIDFIEEDMKSNF